jgi:hypothetical protein
MEINVKTSAQKPPQEPKNKGINVILILLLVVALVMLLMNLNSKNEAEIIPSSNNQPQDTEGEDFMVKNSVADSVLPEGFPSNIPLENGANILVNYSGIDRENRFQATRAFESKNTIDRNVQIYKEYFEREGYQKVELKINEPKRKALVADKGEWYALVVVSDLNDKRIVEISFSKTVLPQEFK